MKWQKFRKKPVVIEAYQTEVAKEINTLEGLMKAEKGDWIIRGIKGELYPCKDNIFEATYDLVDDPVPETDRVYCENCQNHVVRPRNLEDVCMYHVSTDPNHPVRPQVTYGDHEVLNKDGKCEHYNDKREGLGMAADTKIAERR